MYSKKNIYIRALCFSIINVADKTVGYVVGQHIFRTSAYWLSVKHAIIFRNVATCRSLPCTPRKMSLSFNTFYKPYIVATLISLIRLILNTSFYISTHANLHTEKDLSLI